MGSHVQEWMLTALRNGECANRPFIEKRVEQALETYRKSVEQTETLGIFTESFKALAVFRTGLDYNTARMLVDYFQMIAQDILPDENIQGIGAFKERLQSAKYAGQVESFVASQAALFLLDWVSYDMDRFRAGLTKLETYAKGLWEVMKTIPKEKA